MELIPAIDLLGGRVVRLHQGDYDAATAYADDPVAQARDFAVAGARRLHVVDLEGARGGTTSTHARLIEEIVETSGLSVQVGGGIRTREAAERWLAVGAERVVLGTMAVREPNVARALCEEYPGRIVIAIDARGEDVAVEGWTEASGTSARALAERADAWGPAAILYTDIERDGTGEGPAVERTASLQRGLAATVIASGGIGALAHIVALREAGVRAAICGRALYDGSIRIADALRTARGDG